LPCNQEERTGDRESPIEQLKGVSEQANRTPSTTDTRAKLTTKVGFMVVVSGQEAKIVTVTSRCTIIRRDIRVGQHNPNPNQVDQRCAE